jgi:hypothetical protein
MRLLGMEEGGHENMASSVAYTFSLKNWFDENWKDGTEKRHSVDSWDQQVKTLPFGSFNDPLRELTLTVLFQDDLNEHTFHVGLDTKQKWFLSRAFAPKNQQRAFLSTLLEKVIRSWMTDPSNANYSPHRGLVHSLMTAVHSRTDTEKEQVTVIRSEQVERVIHAVFEEPAIKAHPTTIKLAPSFKSPAVPCGSLLWNTLFYSLELLSKNANTSAIGFFKIIWSELLRKIRWHWKHLVPLPHIETLDKEQTIDLRFNIVSGMHLYEDYFIHSILDSSKTSHDSLLHTTKVEGYLKERRRRRLLSRNAIQFRIQFICGRCKLYTTHYFLSSKNIAGR